MRIFLDSFAKVAISIVVVVLTFHAQHALAQDQECPEVLVSDVGAAYFKVGAFDLGRPFECQATKQPAAKFAGYYAPYAIQAALSYVSDHQIVGGPDNFGDQPNVEKAKRLIRQWEYQFDSSSYVICGKPGDKNCNIDRPDRWTLFSTDGLYYQVWARRLTSGRCSEVSIAFRGTANSSLGLAAASWSSNAHGFSRLVRVDDEYDQLARRIDAIVDQIKQTECYKSANGNVQIVSVGHSLGGGLAEFSALANKSGRIKKVFTFNSSPISGPDLIRDRTWNKNRWGLTIDRIYQEGEILSKYSTIRSQQQTPALECNYLTRTVQINAFRAGAPKTRFQKVVHWVSPDAYNAYQQHGIAPLASKLVEWTDERQPYPPLPTNDTACAPDYQMLPAPPAPQELALTEGRQAARPGFGRVAAQALRFDDRSEQRAQEAYGLAEPALMAMRPIQLQVDEPKIAEKRTAVGRTLQSKAPHRHAHLASRDLVYSQVVVVTVP